MKKICLAILILISGIITSCIKTASTTELDIILKPSIGMRKDIATAD